MADLLDRRRRRDRADDGTFNGHRDGLSVVRRLQRVAVAEPVAHLVRADVALDRPRVEKEHPEGLEDIQRFFVVLHPEGRDRLRVLIVGRKRLPEVEGPGQDRFWAFVNRVVESAEEARAGFERTYPTGTRGQRLQPEARSAGEGVYAIVRHGDRTHLAYTLELPERAGAVQEELNIESEASYVTTAKNPERPTPPGVGVSPSQVPEYPDRLRAHFDGRRFAPADPELLDYEGTELVLISAGEDIQEELGIRLNAEEESAHTADVFGQLGLEHEHHPRQPLFGGEWR